MSLTAVSWRHTRSAYKGSPQGALLSGASPLCLGAKRPEIGFVFSLTGKRAEIDFVFSLQREACQDTSRAFIEAPSEPG
jgi:hypothetical protein